MLVALSIIRRIALHVVAFVRESYRHYDAVTEKIERSEALFGVPVREEMLCCATYKGTHCLLSSSHNHQASNRQASFTGKPVSREPTPCSSFASS